MYKPVHHKRLFSVCHRHPEASMRPPFGSIAKLLVTSDLDSVGNYVEQTLGGSLEAGEALYPELQSLYHNE